MDRAGGTKRGHLQGEARVRRWGGVEGGAEVHLREEYRKDEGGRQTWEDHAS